MAILDWISDQLTLLAEAFGEPLTQERAEIYVGGLADIAKDRLQVAFRRARYEGKFFPRLAELREFSGVSAEEEKKVEAQAAWRYANEYLRRWGADKLPIRSGGKWITAPEMEPRLEYAVRQIGGLWRLNQVTGETYPFVYRDFCEAYALAPVAELMATRLLQQFGDRKLLGNVKQLADVKQTEKRATEQESPPSEHAGPTREESVTVIELTAERKAELRRQLNEELTKRGIPPSAAGLE